MTNNTLHEGRQDHSPFGHAQSKLLNFLIRNPGATAHEVREECFPDRTSSYVSNLLYEQRINRLAEPLSSLDSSMPTTWSAKLEQIAQLIDVVHYARTGEFVRKPKNQQHTP